MDKSLCENTTYKNDHVSFLIVTCYVVSWKYAGFKSELGTHLSCQTTCR